MNAFHFLTAIHEAENVRYSYNFTLFPMLHSDKKTYVENNK